MPRTILFDLDEHGSRAWVQALGSLGIDVTITYEAGLSGTTDEEQLAHCLKAVRVVFTQADDYLKLHAAGVPHAGIAYCRQGLRTRAEIVEGLRLIWEIYEPDDMM